MAIVLVLVDTHRCCPAGTGAAFFVLASHFLATLSLLVLGEVTVLASLGGASIFGFSAIFIFHLLAAD